MSSSTLDEQIERESAARAQRIAKEMAAEAEGRTCGQCSFAEMRGKKGTCRQRYNVEDRLITIERPDAVACNEWRPISEANGSEVPYRANQVEIVSSTIPQSTKDKGLSDGS